MSVFRLIHISDIHLPSFAPPSFLELCSKRITGWLNWKLNRTHCLDETVLTGLIADLQHQAANHLVISGDLVNLSMMSEFMQAQQWLKQLGKTPDISLVFGNHDAYVPGAFKKACRIFSPWITEEDNAATVSFPYCRQRGEVAIIGVNSSQATRPFSAQGFFEKHQANRLAKILSAAKDFFRIVVIHHPPIHHAVSPHKALKGIDLFQQVVRDYGAELILHGHSHLPSLHFIKGAGSPLPVVGVASASQGLGIAKKPPANFNIFEIERRPAAWHCLLIRRTLIDDQGHFAETERRPLYAP